jgi:hypothetical protein
MRKTNIKSSHHKNYRKGKKFVAKYSDQNASNQKKNRNTEAGEMLLLTTKPIQQKNQSQNKLVNTKTQKESVNINKESSRVV